jgi:cyclic beta-1,2-glucan synthetase
MRVAAPPHRSRAPLRSPHTSFPHTQFLSNGNYVDVGHNAGGGAASGAACR